MRPPGKVKSKRSPSKLRLSWGPEDVDEVETSIDSDPVVERLPSSSPVGKSVMSVHSSNAKPSSAGRKRRNSDNVACPVCLQRPFHLRYRCPVIEAGPDSIEKRLEELKSGDNNDQTLLIQELEHLLRTHRAKTNVPKSGLTESVVNFSPINATSTPAARPSQRPIIPSELRLSEVTVEARDEGSSNEGSDDEDSDDENDDDIHADMQSESRYPYKLPSAFGNLSFLADMDLDAVIRGPMSQAKSVLDELPSRSDSEKDEDSQQEDDVLDEDADDRKYRMRSKKLDNASSDEGEDHDIPESSDDEDDVTPETLSQLVKDDGAIQAGSQDTPASCDNSKLTSVTGGRWFEWLRR